MIIHLASEVAPFYKRGGLGDVVGTLPVYLNNKQSNTVISFYYKNRMKGKKPKFMGSIYVDIQNIKYEFHYYGIRENNIDFYFINMSDELVFSDMESGESDTTTDDGEKPYGENFPFTVYMYFAKASLKLIEFLKLQPKTLFFHDWHVCGCFAYPSKLRSICQSNNGKSVVLIHNYEFQGEVLPDQLHLLEEEALNEFLPIYNEFGMATFFALAFKNADYVATVSKTYAEELLQKKLPHVGLDFLKLIKNKKIIALPNGIDHNFWSPYSSPYLKKPYSIETVFEGKRFHKRQLEEKIGFKHSEEPIILLMARLTEQKGINIIIDLWNSEEKAMRKIKELINKKVRLLIYGRPSKGLSGNIHKRLSKASALFPEKFAYIPDYTEEMAHKFLAGSDMILCPSLFEPCGLVQMFGLSFGTVPIVRPVGGLKDTVIDYDQNPEQATGFYIERFDNSSLADSIEKASVLYKNNKTHWNKIINNGMKKDYSWPKVIGQYEDFFNRMKKEKQNQEVLLEF